MSLLTRIVVTTLQIPSEGQRPAELRAKAVQQLYTEPVKRTPEVTENGEANVTQKPQGVNKWPSPT